MSAVVVYHAYYGCDTGCCGHRIEMGDREDIVMGHLWEGDDARTFAEALVAETFGAEHVKDLDWEHCVIVGYNECEL